MNLERSSALVRCRSLTAQSWTPALTALYTDPNCPAPPRSRHLSPSQTRDTGGAGVRALPAHVGSHLDTA